MPIYESEIRFQSTARAYVSDITDTVNDLIKETRTDSGLLWATSLHTTLGLQINEGREPNLLLDLVDIGQRLVPEDERGSWVIDDQEYPFPTVSYRHYCGDNRDLGPDEEEDDRNAGRHGRAMVLGERTLPSPYRRGKLLLGRFQRFLIMEFDGRPEPARERRIHILIDPFDKEIEQLEPRRLALNAGHTIG